MRILFDSGQSTQADGSPLVYYGFAFNRQGVWAAANIQPSGRWLANISTRSSPWGDATSTTIVETNPDIGCETARQALYHCQGQMLKHTEQLDPSGRLTAAFRLVSDELVTSALVAAGLEER